MTLKELAHLAQQTLQDRAGCPVKRSHVHELLAAAFGHRSWAAFLNELVLADAGVGSAPTGGLPELIGRAVQLGYGQQAAATVATSLAAFIAEHQLSAVSWADLRVALLPAAPVDRRDELDEDDDDDEGWDDERPTAAPTAAGPAREQLMRSPMLLSGLEQAAGPANLQGHFLLAALYRCGRPNPYLYEESLKGRVLTTIERGWGAGSPQPQRPRARQAAWFPGWGRGSWRFPVRVRCHDHNRNKRNSAPLAATIARRTAIRMPP